MAAALSPTAWRRIVAGLQEQPPAGQAVVALRQALLRLSRGSRLRPSDDLVSDVLVRVLERPRLLLTVRRPETYLRLLLRREQFVALRRADLDARARQQAARSARLAEALEGGSPGPQAGLVDRMDLERLLERAGERLTDDDRRLLQMRFWEGQDLKTMAQTLGIPYGSAAARVFRLLAKLRASLQGGR